MGNFHKKTMAAANLAIVTIALMSGETLSCKFLIMSQENLAYNFLTLRAEIHPLLRSHHNKMFLFLSSNKTFFT